MHTPPTPTKLALGVALLASLSVSAHANRSSETRVGDHLSLALPAGMLAYELVRGDREGAWQLAQTFALTTATAEVLKRHTGVTRPDGSNDLSFPSGHAARAFSAAAYARKRHGMEMAWPLYVAATYVGHTRVDARRHRWGDVAASALLAEGFAHWRVTPAGAQMQAGVGPEGAFVALSWTLR
ncbi:MAG: phosphatase PAP2 family protein [Roseateles sp.]